MQEQWVSRQVEWVEPETHRPPDGEPPDVPAHRRQRPGWRKLSGRVITAAEVPTTDGRAIVLRVLRDDGFIAVGIRADSLTSVGPPESTALRQVSPPTIPTPEGPR